MYASAALDFLLGDGNRQLAGALVFVLGLHMSLRGRREGRRLRIDPSQIIVQIGSIDGGKALELQNIAILI